MLVAQRDPFHAGAEDASVSGGRARSRVARAMSALQIAGTLLAIPVGLGSAYSMYRANFSVETTCQSLRANIVAMLDKSVDASTRHMLVRRDIEAFQATCGAVDPDATAAFKVLLADENKSAPVAASVVAPVATTVPPRAEAKPEAVVRKAEPRPAVVAKQPAAAPAPVVSEAKPAQRDAATSDAMWLAAVRQALVTHGPNLAPETRQSGCEYAARRHQAVRSRCRAKPACWEKSAHKSAGLPAPALCRRRGQSSRTGLGSPRRSSAPMSPADADHPVPPAPIPECPSANDANATPAQEHKRSRLGDFVAQIPLVGWLSVRRPDA